MSDEKIRLLKKELLHFVKKEKNVLHGKMMTNF